MCEGELMARSFNLNIDLSRSVVWVSPAWCVRARGIWGKFSPDPPP